MPTSDSLTASGTSSRSILCTLALCWPRPRRPLLNSLRSIWMVWSGIEFRGVDFGFFLIAESGPAALAVPVLADFFAVIESYFDLHRASRNLLCAAANVGLVDGVSLSSFFRLVFVFFIFVPVHGKGIDSSHLVVHDLRAVDRLVEIPAQIFAGNFLDRLQEIFFRRDG